jgi:hypothetical protein
MVVVSAPFATIHTFIWDIDLMVSKTPHRNEHCGKTVVVEEKSGRKLPIFWFAR